MEIIKNGIDHGGVFKHVCKTCGCVFEYVLEDIHFRDPNDDSWGDSLPYVICPCCTFPVYHIYQGGTNR